MTILKQAWWVPAHFSAPKHEQQVPMQPGTWMFSSLSAPTPSQRLQLLSHSRSGPQQPSEGGLGGGGEWEAVPPCTQSDSSCILLHRRLLQRTSPRQHAHTSPHPADNSTHLCATRFVTKCIAAFVQEMQKHPQGQQVPVHISAMSSPGAFLLPALLSTPVGH